MLRTVAFLTLLALAAPAQVTVTLKPISLVTTRKVIGEGRRAGLWTVTSCSDAGVRLLVDRGRIASAFPELRDLPNDLAEDVVGRQTAADVRSVLGSKGDELIGFASQGLAVGGFITGTDGAGYAGLALAGAQMIFRMLGKTAPTATPYYSRLLPDQVTVPPGGCAPTYYLFASLMQGARTLQARIIVPVVSQ